MLNAAYAYSCLPMEPTETKLVGFGGPVIPDPTQHEEHYKTMLRKCDDVHQDSPPF